VIQKPVQYLWEQFTREKASAVDGTGFAGVRG